MAEDIKHQTKKGIYWTFFNQLAKNGLGFIVGIVMARLLSPSDYGITALPAIFTGVAYIFMESGFTTAMIRKPDITDDDLTTSFTYNAVAGLLFYILFFFCAPLIADFYDQAVLTPLIRVTTLSFLWEPLSAPQTIILRRNLDFKKIANISISSNIIGAVTGIAFAYMGYGLWALVIMGTFQSFIAFVMRWFTVKWTPKGHWSRDSFKYLWNFGNKLMASSMIGVIYSNLTPMIIGKFFSPAQLGIYNRAMGYASLPAVQGTNVVQSVTLPVLSKLQDDDTALANAYRKMLKVSAFVIFPVMTLLSALAKPFIVILVTEKWIDSVIFLQLICFSMMWYPVNSINLNLLTVKGRSDLFLKLEIWKKILGLTVMAFTLPFGLIYFVSAGIASSFIGLFINTYYTGKLINVGFMKQMQDLLPTYGLSILIFCVVFGMNQFIDNLWIQLIFGGTVGVALYLGLAILFKFSELQDVKYMLNRNK